MQEIISFGGGVNSTAMAIMLIKQGWKGEIVFADTGCEWPETCCFLDYFEREWLGQRGFSITRLKGLPWQKYNGGSSLIEYCEQAHVIPMAAVRWCTVEWKIKPLKHYAPDATHLIGIAADESHRQPDKVRPLVDAGITRRGCIEIIEAEGLSVPQKSGCYICLSGETEVLTPSGARPIANLVGKATILVPIRQSHWGKWQEAEIKCFGKQKLYRLTLNKRRVRKEIYATAEHRWVKVGIKGRMPFVSTLELQKGDVLASCYVTSVTASPHEVRPSPFGVAHGFVFGDGTCGENDRRPASCVLYKSKDQAMLRYFTACESREITRGGKAAIYVYDLPRHWKDFPSVDESRSYLLGWLAGYFAADGHVTPRGQAVIYSHVRENMEFVRNVCYLLGVRTCPIRKKNHFAFGRDRLLYSVTIYNRDMPDSFWLNAHHLDRIISSRSQIKERRDEWTVVSVEETNRVEDVYCAIVPGQEMFTLADNVVTGNCPFQRDNQWRRLWQVHPELFDRAMQLEESTERTRENRFRASLDVNGKTTLRERLARYEGQTTMGWLEDDDLLAYKPCVCGL